MKERSMENPLEKFIHTLDFQYLQHYLRTKNDTFEPNQNISLTHFSDENFSDPQLIGTMKINQSGNINYSFITCLIKSNKELSERSSKKNQFKKAKLILKNLSSNVITDLCGGFFIFHDSKNFRFSLVFKEPKGKKEVFSPFQRYTYFVSPNLTNKTFLQQLCTKVKFDSLETIKDAFSVNKVTKEFYREIVSWFYWVLSDVSVKYPPSVEKQKNGKELFLIRLLSRTIFIWFMKVKGLIPEELFNEDKLREILKDLSPNSTSYYKAILQNLFFATLNTPKEKRIFRSETSYHGKNNDYMNHNKYRYHDLFKKPDEIENLFAKIPFLNGGLFECLDKPKNDPKNSTEEELRLDGFSSVASKQPQIPNRFFFSDGSTANLSQFFKEKYYRNAHVRGLIKILHSYNFTIDENVPGDEEIALDPELLGKIFENLLASYNEETTISARKATGSFYTPREIVDFMVNISIKEYLKNELTNQIPNFEDRLEKLMSPEEDDDFDTQSNPFSEDETNKIIQAINNVKILDPAVGSGAFLMGALHTLTRILSKLDPHNQKWLQLQIENIQNSILEPQLREEIIKKIKEQFELNELDYGRKLYLIRNCLFGIDIQPLAIQLAKLRFFISLLVDEKFNDAMPNRGIEPLPNLETKLIPADALISINKNIRFLSSTEIKNEERKLFEIRKKYFSEPDQSKKEKLKEEDRFIRNKIKNLLQEHNLYDDNLEKILSWDPYDPHTSAGWFDPEWMFGVTDSFDIVIGNPPYIQLQKDKGKLARLYENQNFQTFDRSGDIYVLFYEKGLNLLKDNRILCFITSNKWMRAGYGEKLRELFMKHNPILLIDLGPKVFESSTVDTNILLIKKSPHSDTITKQLSTQSTSTKALNIYQLRGLTLKKENNEPININEQLNKHSILMTRLSTGPWFIGSNAEQRLKEKIEHIGKPLKDWGVKINYGIKTGLDEAFIITTEKREEILANCKDADERKRTSAIIKPILRGRDIKRYYYEWKGSWVIIIPTGWTNKYMGNEEPEKFVNNYYPSLMSHLKKYEQKAKKRDDQGDYWWELRPCEYYEEFEKEKVVWGNINYNSNFCFVEKGIYINAPANFAISVETSIKYLIAQMNSKIFDWQFKQVGIFLGRAFEWKKQYVEKIRIPPITQSNRGIVNQIEELVDKIIHSKKQDKNADTSQWERKIDQLVYKLYELTPNEIKVIEQQT